MKDDGQESSATHRISRTVESFCELFSLILNQIKLRFPRTLGDDVQDDEEEQQRQEDKPAYVHFHNHLFLSLFCAVPPTIAPFSFKKDLSEGLRAQVTCMVEKGDPPFTIIWSKDGEPISASGTAAAAAYGSAAAAATINDLRQHSQTPPGLRVTNIDAHSSAIVIERVTAAHTGNYTCLARNSVAEVLWTAELIVRGKVKSTARKTAPNLCFLFFFLSLTSLSCTWQRTTVFAMMIRRRRVNEVEEQVIESKREVIELIKS